MNDLIKWCRYVVFKDDLAHLYLAKTEAVNAYIKKKNEKPDAPILDSGGHVIKAIEEKKDDGKIRDARGQVIQEPIKEMPKKKTEMI